MRQPSLAQYPLRKMRPPRLDGLAFALCLGYLPAWALASSSAAPAAQVDQMSVRELMRLDTALALRQLRSSLDTGTAGTALPVAHSGKLKLLALYGVGKRLVAEVMIGGDRHVYMRDRSLPIGVKPHPSVYQLRGISGSCVHLERKDEAHTLCLQPALGMAQ